MRIRPFVSGDQTAISEIIAANLDNVNARDHSPSAIDAMKRRLTPEGVLERTRKRDFYVAIDGERLVGVGSLDKNIVKTVFVVPATHKKGVGTLLMDFLEERARLNGYHHTTLVSSKSAVEFYKKRGYAHVRTDHDEIFGEAIIMEKMLS